MSKQASLFSVAICLSIFVCSCTPQPQMHCYWYDPNTGRTMTEEEYQEWKAAQPRVLSVPPRLDAYADLAKMPTYQPDPQFQERYYQFMKDMMKIIYQSPTERSASDQASLKRIHQNHPSKPSTGGYQDTSAMQNIEHQRTQQRRIDELYDQAKLGNAKAQYDLGIKLIQGDGIPKNTTEGLEWIRKSSMQGYKKSQDFMEKLYLESRKGFNQ